MPFPDYGDVPAWLAVGVAACALFGAGLLYRRQSEQLDDQRKVSEKLTTVLELQSAELRESLSERLRAQAAQIFIEVDRVPPAAGGAVKRGQEKPGPLPWLLRAKVHNTSTQPIYDLYVIWQLGTVRMGRPDPMARLMPGGDASFERTVGLVVNLANTWRVELLITNIGGPNRSGVGFGEQVNVTPIRF